MEATRQSVNPAVVVACLVGFLALLWPPRTFVLDDAFVVFRFAENLAHGHGIVWNAGEAPVEGFINLGWVLLQAGAIAAGVDPVLSAKAVGCLAALGAICWLLALGRRTPAFVVGGLLASVALSPSFAFQAMQGMETTLVALCLVGVAASTRRLVHDERPRAAFALFAWLLAACLVRLDTGAFVLGAVPALLLVLATSGPRAVLARTASVGLGCAVLGALFFAWRTRYFGHLLPNTWYVKVDAGGLHLAYLRSYLAELAWPVLAVALVGLLVTGPRRRAVAASLPTLAGCAAAFAYLLTVKPIQAFEWRYAVPAHVALVAGALILFDGARPRSAAAGRTSLALATLALVGAWHLRGIPRVVERSERSSPTDRIAAGRALADLDGTMFVTEAGAVPYFSGWRSADLLGLTSTDIARDGFSAEFLARLDPDVIQIKLGGPFEQPWRRAAKRLAGDLRVLEAYMAQTGHRVVGITAKDDQAFHYYFARPGSALWGPVRGRLAALEGVDLPDPREFVLDRHLLPDDLR